MKKTKQPRKLICSHPECKKEFERVLTDKQFENLKPNNFCSVACSATYQGKKNTGEGNGMYGKPSIWKGLTKDTSEALRQKGLKLSGEKHPRYGKPMTEEEKEKQRIGSLKSEKKKLWYAMSYDERMMKAHGSKEAIAIMEEKKKNKMKGSYSLPWFKEKYGDEEGSLLYEKRCARIKETSFFKTYNKTNKNNYSKISQKLFFEIYEKIKDKFAKIYFAELNHEHAAMTGASNFDFVVLDNKRIIEYHGEMFHPKEGDLDWVNPYKVTYEEQIAKDNLKKEKAEANGFKILYVWHNDFKSNPSLVINSCLDFLLLP